MRVRISYSVDLEEVPDTVSELLTGTSLDLLLCGGMVNEIGKDLSTRALDEETVLKTLDDIRKKLTVVDQTISESINLIAGYFAAGKVPPETQQAEPVEAEVGTDAV